MSKTISAKQLLETYKTEINIHDFSRIAPLLSEDCTFWFSSGTYVGLDAARKAFEKTWNLIKEEIYTISNFTWICEDEKAAACTYTYHWKGLINGALQEGAGRGTSCFRLEHQGWKIVHEHLSLFPEQKG